MFEAPLKTTYVIQVYSFLTLIYNGRLSYSFFSSMYPTCSCFVATRTATADLKVSVNDLTARKGITFRGGSRRETVKAKL